MSRAALSEKIPVPISALNVQNTDLNNVPTNAPHAVMRSLAASLLLGENLTQGAIVSQSCVVKLKHHALLNHPLLRHLVVRLMTILGRACWMTLPIMNLTPPLI